MEIIDVNGQEYELVGVAVLSDGRLALRIRIKGP